MPMRLTTCGNSCDSCKAFKENYEKFDEREALSKAWKKYLDFDRAPEDIHCYGNTCCAIGLGIVHENCQYKECTKLHGVEHCGQCPEYPCSHFDDGRNMDEISLRDKLKENFDIEEYERYVKVFDNKSWVKEYYQLIQESKNFTMCGYRCDLCKAYAANIKSKDERKELSAIWMKYFDSLDICAEDIYCDGCRCMKEDSNRMDSDCPVRTCVLGKKIEHCGVCTEYPCEVSQQRAGLTCAEAKAKAGEAFNQEEYSQYLLAYDNKTRIDEFRIKNHVK